MAQDDPLITIYRFDQNPKCSPDADRTRDDDHTQYILFFNWEPDQYYYPQQQSGYS
jgi:hypothetical protein